MLVFGLAALLKFAITVYFCWHLFPAYLVVENTLFEMDNLLNVFAALKRTDFTQQNNLRVSKWVLPLFNTKSNTFQIKNNNCVQDFFSISEKVSMHIH